MSFKYENHHIMLVAHRGLAMDYPENTSIAIQAALQSNADILEIDLHKTRDGQLVVIHDDSIDRTSNGSGKVGEQTLNDLRQYDYGINSSPRYPKQTLLTFDEVLTLIKASSQALLIEMKQHNHYPGIENDLIDKLKQYELNKNQVIIQSFDQNFIKQLYLKHYGYRLGVLISKKRYWYKMPSLNKISKYADYVNPHFSLVTETFMKKAHYYGLKVMPYTVNDKSQAIKLIRLGVDGLISDKPHRLFY